MYNNQYIQASKNELNQMNQNQFPKNQNCKSLYINEINQINQYKYYPNQYNQILNVNQQLDQFIYKREPQNQILNNFQFKNNNNDYNSYNIIQFTNNNNSFNIPFNNIDNNYINNNQLNHNQYPNFQINSSNGNTAFQIPNDGYQNNQIVQNLNRIQPIDSKIPYNNINQLKLKDNLNNNNNSSIINTFEPIKNECDTGNPKPMPESLSNKLYNSIVNIRLNSGLNGTGFFMRIKIDKKEMKCLLTCKHVITQNDIDN